MDNQENSGCYCNTNDVEELCEFRVAFVDLGVHDIGVLLEDSLNKSFDVVVCSSQDLINGVWLVEEHEVNVVVVSLKVVEGVVGVSWGQDMSCLGHAK